MIGIRLTDSELKKLNIDTKQYKVCTKEHKRVSIIPQIGSTKAHNISSIDLKEDVIKGIDTSVEVHRYVHQDHKTNTRSKK